jgi:hypothetical protein
MKKYLKYILVLSSIFIGIVKTNTSFAQEPIIINPGISDDNNGGIPRLPSIVPISGFVEDGVIHLNFSCDLGNVSVVIEHSVFGIILQTVVDGSDPEAIIPFLEYPGDYTIYFTTSGGNSYIGRFSIY